MAKNVCDCVSKQNQKESIQANSKYYSVNLRTLVYYDDILTVCFVILTVMLVISLECKKDRVDCTNLCRDVSVCVKVDEHFLCVHEVDWRVNSPHAQHQVPCG